MDLEKQVRHILFALPVKLSVSPFLKQLWCIPPDRPIVDTYGATGACPGWRSSAWVPVLFSVFRQVFYLLYSWQVWALSLTVFSHLNLLLQQVSS
jgi:hypothetical protein